MDAADTTAAYRPLILQEPVVLVGLMGSGKSSIGRRLAKSLIVPFFDSDTEIETRTGMSIPVIFQNYGESHFRQIERDVIARLMEGAPAVVATGGGAFMDDASRKLIKENAVSIWLRVALPVLLERVARKNNRPLLEAGDKETILKQLMEVRYPVYAEADIVIDSGDGPHNFVVTDIIDALHEYYQ